MLNKEYAGMAQSVAHFIGSEEVTGSIPVASLILWAEILDFSRVSAFLFLLHLLHFTLHSAALLQYIIFIDNIIHYYFSKYPLFPDHF